MSFTKRLRIVVRIAIMNECKGCRFWGSSVNLVIGVSAAEGEGWCKFFALFTPQAFSCAFYEPRTVGESAVSRARQAVQVAIAMDEYLTERLPKNDLK